MHCCAVIESEHSDRLYQIIFWDLDAEGAYRSYFYENRGYRPIYRKDIKILKDYRLHDFSVWELEREMEAIDRNPELRGYSCDPHYKEELRTVLDTVRLYSSPETNLLKISYGIKL